MYIQLSLRSPQLWGGNSQLQSALSAVNLALPLGDGSWMWILFSLAWCFEFFSAAQTIDKASEHTFATATGIAAGDFDGDGHNDLVSHTDAGAIQQAARVRGLGDLSFAARTNLPSRVIASRSVLDAYDYNGDGYKCPGRSDCVGWFVYKYSDDHGRTWSKERYRLPMRMTAVDRTNTFDGKVQIFWGIGKPITYDGTMMFAFSKCGKYLIDRSEGWFYRSDNILTEPDVTKLDWQLLPDGEIGLKNPTAGNIQAEHNLVALDDGSTVRS